MKTFRRWKEEKGMETMQRIPGIFGDWQVVQLGWSKWLWEDPMEFKFQK